MMNPRHGPREDPRDAELDGVRIRQLATLRRAAVRARSYAIIGLGVACVCVGQLVYLTIRDIRSFGWLTRDLGFVAGALIVGQVGWICLRLVVRLHGELRARVTQAAPAAAPPDFATLSDGSQYAKNLESLAAGEHEGPAA